MIARWRASSMRSPERPPRSSSPRVAACSPACSSSRHGSARHLRPQRVPARRASHARAPLEPARARHRRRDRRFTRRHVLTRSRASSRIDGVGRVRVIDHEDDLPEVALLVDWAWRRLDAESRRVLGVLSHVEGDHVDRVSLGVLARSRNPARALAPLQAGASCKSRWKGATQFTPSSATLSRAARSAPRSASSRTTCRSSSASQTD